MLRTHLKMAWRSILKGKVYSIINISGLAIGIACTLTIALYISDEYSYDRFHENHQEIYRVVEIQDHEGDLHPVAATPGLLAEALKRDYAEIIKTCRVSCPVSAIFSLDKTNIESSEVIAADHSFFSLFDFRMVMGNAETALLEPDEIVITEKVAAQLFGIAWRTDHAVLGRQLIINNSDILTVAGVAQDCPANSHIQFDVIVSMKYEELQRPYYFSDWQNHNYHTYIQVRPGTNASVLEEKLKDYLLPLKTWSKPTLWLQALDKIYLHSRFDYGDWVKTSSILYLRIFMAVGAIVLLIAVFNFVNLSTARATQRAKEVGVRKVIGAVHRQLVHQFLTETFVMTLLSMIIAVTLVFMFVPMLNEISEKTISVPVTPFGGFVLLGTTVVLSFLAGIYPSFLLSNFQPVKVLKGFFRTAVGQVFRRTLVVTQFSFSVILMLGAIVIYAQLIFMQEKDMGFDKEQLIFLRLKNQLFSQAKMLKEDLLSQSSIQAVAATSHDLLEVKGSTHAVAWEGKGPDDSFPMSHMNVDPDFLITTGITLLSGRDFDPKLSSDSTSWLINEAAIKRMGWTPKEAVGKSMQLWGTQGTVVGVVKDFHFRPLTASIEPMLFRYWSGDPLNFKGLFIRTTPGRVTEAIAVIERLYKKYESQTIAQYTFVDESLSRSYRVEQNTGRTVLYFSILAILVSCLGLFGLTTFSTGQRTREIGIRKVLGADVLNVVTMLSRDFMSLVGIAIVMALPLGWWMMERWLQTFAYHIEVQWWMAVSVTAVVASIALLTMSAQTIRTAVANPVKALKLE
jgi:putative ABC transport system permease protein